jgi:hypothetical protein
LRSVRNLVQENIVAVGILHLQLQKRGLHHQECWYTAVSDSRTWEGDSVFNDEDKLFEREGIPENQYLKLVSALGLGFIYERDEECHWSLYT